MTALDFRASLVGLIVGIAGCSAASETPPQTDSGVGRVTGAQWGADSMDGSPPAASNSGTMPSKSGDSGANDPAGQGCDCATQPPGIDVVQSDAGAQVEVKLPLGGTMIVGTVDGRIETSDTGVDINGDVSVDVGGNVAIALTDASLHIETGQNGHPPKLSGDAQIDGRLLKPACACDGKLLPATIALDVDKSAALGVTLGIDVALPRLTIDTSSLSDAHDATVISNAHMVLDTDGTHETAKITGNLSDYAGTSSSLPLAAIGALRATAQLRDHQLFSVELDGAIRLRGDTLWCGLTPLNSLELVDAKLIMGNDATRLEARSRVSPYPGFVLDGTARLVATFQKQGWEIDVCGSTMTGPIGSSVEANTCLQLTHDGAKTCPDTEPH